MCRLGDRPIRWGFSWVFLPHRPASRAALRPACRPADAAKTLQIGGAGFYAPGAGQAREAVRDIGRFGMGTLTEEKKANG